MLTNEERQKKIKKLQALSNVLCGRTAASYQTKKGWIARFLRIQGFDLDKKRGHLDDLVILAIHLACVIHVTELKQEMQIQALKKELDAVRLAHLS